jgi:hypothetical protein
MERNVDFFEIVKDDQIEIVIPEDSHFSIATSPYYAHQHGLAIDIYHRISIENYGVVSPIGGIVDDIREFAAPEPRFTNGINKEYLLLIKNPKNPEHLFKILHIDPSIEIGDEIEVGTPLGNTIRNGYFAPWSSPHIHLELRSPSHPFRARGGTEFSLATNKSFKTYGKPTRKYSYKEIPLIIETYYPEFLLCRFPKHFYGEIYPIVGLKGMVDENFCIIDGGIPQYKNGIALFSSIIKDFKNKSVRLNNQHIGDIDKINKQFGFFNCEHTRFLLNNKEIRGISLFLAKSRPYVKIIPYQKDQYRFKKESTPYLKILSHIN